MRAAYPRRTILGGFIGLSAVATGRLPKQTSSGVAITVDDFDLTDTPVLSGFERDRSIRTTLARHRIKAAGFVAGKYIVGETSDDVLKAWSSEGHILGNHTFSHRFYGGGPDAYMADIRKCEGLLTGYAGFRKLFRFPYLAEGKTAQARDALRNRLHAAGYRLGHVTIDTSDWAVDGRLRQRLAQNPGADLEPYRRFYLRHIWERATYYDGLARSLFGGPIDHTLLLHHRLTTALFLDDLLDMFRGQGWRLVNAQTALASPIMKLEPKSLPSGQSLVWAVAKERSSLSASLRYPGEDERYEIPAMDAARL